MTNEIARPGQINRPTTWTYRRLADSVLLSQEDIDLLNALRPRCAQCNKLVEGFSWTRSMNGPYLCFTVHCHGAVEETKVSYDMLPALMMGGVQGAVAFQDKPKIEHENAC
jgi:hypothetical protein